MVNTAADLEAVLFELIAREPIFHRPEWGTTRADFENMTAPTSAKSEPPAAATIVLIY